MTMSLRQWPHDILVTDHVTVGERVDSRAVYCNGWRKSGKPCGHKVAVVPVDEWDDALQSKVEIECASCRKVAILREFI